MFKYIKYVTVPGKLTTWLQEDEPPTTRQHLVLPL